MSNRSRSRGSIIAQFVGRPDREFCPIHRDDGWVCKWNADWPLPHLCNSGGPTRLCHLPMNRHGRVERGQLSITTSRRHCGDPPPDPNPPGPTPGMTPKSAQSLPGPVPSADTPSQDPLSSKGRIMKGQYTCYAWPCINCADPFPTHIMSECKEATDPNMGLRLMWSCVTHWGIRMLGQAHRWNSQLTAKDQLCAMCGTELGEHNLRECIMKARVRVDLLGWFSIAPSNTKENLDKCPVYPRSHSHKDIGEMKRCYLGRKAMFESSQRINWHLALRSLRLSEAEEPCPKCRCFWRGHDQEQCRGVGTCEDNLWVVHGHYHLELLGILKEIVQTREAKDNPPCPLCNDKDSHDWLECVRMAHYNPLELLDCEVTMRPPLVPLEIPQLRTDPLLWLEDDADGNPVVRSHIPSCRFCNWVNAMHFPLECTQAWGELEICKYPCYKCWRDGSNHVSEECWVIWDHQQTRQDLLQGLEECTKQMEFCLEGNQCPLCSKSLLHDRHTIEHCLEDYSWKLVDPQVQAIPKTEATWKIYEGDIEITRVRNKPSSSLRECGFCKQRRPLHYPKECLTEGPPCHPCRYGGKEGPDHVPDKDAEARGVNALFQQHVQFQWALLYQGICYVCQMPKIPDGHVEKCLSAKLVPTNEGWAPPLVHVDTVLGSGLPQCSYCGQAWPLHYPGDCNNVLYEADWMPCLVCGSDGHIPEECPILGTSVVGHATSLDMLEAYLTKYQNRGQCYICKAYHLQGGEYGQLHFTSKQCLHSLLAWGSLRWDREETLLQWSQDHHWLLHILEPKRQRGLDGRPLVKKTPKQQWMVKALVKTFIWLKDQRSVPLVFTEEVPG